MKAYVATNTNYTYDQWRTVQHQDYIVFKTKAAGNAHIALTPFMSWVGLGYEVVIGGWGNTQSVIRDGENKGTHYATAATKGENCILANKRTLFTKIFQKIGTAGRNTTVGSF